MSYDAILKTYAAATPSSVRLDLTGVFESFKFTLDVRHICCGATLELMADDGEDFALAEGEIVRAFFSSSDTDPIWAGMVTRRVRDVNGDTHSYELAGLWSGLDGVLITTAKTWTSTSAGAIVAELFETYIGGIVPLVVDDTSGIIAPGVLDSYSVKAGDELSKILETLAALAPAAGEAWACGVDGGGNFVFAAVSTDAGDLQIDAQVSLDVVQAKETHSREKRQVLTIVGDYSRAIGGRAKKTFATGEGSGRRLTVAVPGLRTSAGLERFAMNWLARYADPTAQVTGLEHVRLADEDAPPLPQNGRARYRDDTAGYDITDYIKTIDVDFGEWFEYSITLGQAGDSDDPKEAADPYSPAALDSYIGGDDYAAIEALPEATDVDPLPDDFPRGWSEDDLRAIAADEAGSAGRSGVGRGYVLNIWPCAAIPGQAMHIIAEIENGGTAFAAGEIIFHARQIESGGTVVSTVYQAGESIGSHGSVGIWKTQTGFTFTGEGQVYFAVEAITDPLASPQVVVYSPADVSDSENWAKCPSVRLVADAADSLLTATTIIAGWLGAVS